MHQLRGRVAVVTGASSGIERNQLRVRIGVETYIGDWMKRLFPVWTQKLIERGAARQQAGS